MMRGGRGGERKFAGDGRSGRNKMSCYLGAYEGVEESNGLECKELWAHGEEEGRGVGEIIVYGPL